MIVLDILQHVGIKLGRIRHSATESAERMQTESEPSEITGKLGISHTLTLNPKHKISETSTLALRHKRATR